MKNKFLRLEQVTEYTTLSRSSIYEHIARGDFPRPVRLGQRHVVWLESDLERWFKGQIVKRDKEILEEKKKDK